MDADHDRLVRATADLEAPFALVDLDAFRANAADLVRRAAPKPVRVASKSVRCRALLAEALARDGFRGLMTFTLAETLWLHGQGVSDLLLAYPTADRAALRALGRLDAPRGTAPVLMVDAVAHLDLVDAAAGTGPERRPVRVCLDVDTSLELAGGRVRVGPKRSPLRTPADAAALAREVVRRPGFELWGVMGYEGHVAGVGDKPPNPAMGVAIRAMQRRAVAQVRERRAAVVEAVRAVADGPLSVNGGGTGSLERTAAEDAVTEVTAGSGLYSPTLFDHYRGFRHRPAAMFCLPVVRKPSPDVATLLGGGYPASGAAGRDRLPEPYLPAGLALTGVEGAGEVQTPVTGGPAAALRVGDRVFLRHAKAGELCERFDVLHLVEGDRVVDAVPTYRGEGRTFL